MPLQITITNAGRAEIINAENTGTGPVVITEIGFGTGQYAPSKTQLALQAQVKRLSSIAGQAVAADTIHVMAKDEGPDAYNVGEFGLFSASGTLVAVYSQPLASGWIIQKSGASTLLLATDIILESLNATNLTFGDITFINPPATIDTPGVVQLENSLLSSSISKALTALQGKKLQDEKAPLASPALSGTPTAPTAAAGTNTTQLATTAFVAAVKTLLDTAIALKAPLASPALTGAPTAPTAAPGTNTTQLANTAFVQAAIAALVDASPGTLDTLNELAAALGDDPNFATTITNALALKAPLASPALTGAPTAPTAVAGTNTTQLATTAFVAAVKTLLDTAIALKAPLASPALTGTPTAPTPAQFDNDTSIATSAFVQRALGNHSGSRQITATGALSVSDVGDFITAAFSANGTITLPDLALVPEGAMVVINSDSGSGVVVNVAGYSTQLIAVAGIGVGSVPVRTGEFLVLVKQTMWRAYGSATIGSSAGFAGLMGSPGYQKLPNGFVIQWGSTTSSGTAAGNATVTPPINFPTGCLHALAGIVGSGATTNFTVQTGSITANSIPMTTLQNGVITTGIGVRWFAIGY